MCSIAGRAATPSASASLRDLGILVRRVRAMIDTSPGRGPDHQDVTVHGSVILGHSRLAVRDPSPAASQPMVTPDGRYVLSFNGEIYNHAELREELIRGTAGPTPGSDVRAAVSPAGPSEGPCTVHEGVRFRTTGDTEVLLHILARDGEAALARLNGEFAFAFLDTHTGRVILARDLYGVKPVSYVVTPDAVWFASEPRALLLPAGPAAREEDPVSVARFLVENRTDDGERTFFRNVRQVRPGHRLIIEDGRIVADHPYRVLPHEDPAPGDLRAALDRAVALRLEADARVGVSLSGGLDSSTILGLAARHHGTGIPTFTAAMPDPRLDESAIAAATAKRTGASPTFVLMPPPTIPEVHALIAEQGAPCGSLGVLASRRVAHAAHAAGVTVMVDGQGADEAMGGYAHFLSARLASLVREYRLAAFLSEARRAPRRVLFEAAYLLLPRSLRTRVRARTLKRARGWLHPDLARRAPLDPAPAFHGRRSLLKQVLAASLTQTSLPSILRYADRNTANTGVEGRYPFLDPDVIRVVFALPDDALMSGGWTKRALRDAADGIVCDDIRSCRDKRAFETPDRAWLTGPLAESFLEHLTDGRLDARGWLLPGAGARLAAAYRDGTDGGVALRVFLLEAWARVHLDASPALATPTVATLRATAAPRAHPVPEAGIAPAVPGNAPAERV